MPADNLNENVETLASLHARSEDRASAHQKRIERLTALVGRPLSLYLVIAFATSWTLWNLVAPHVGARPWDPPPFSWLQALVTSAALLMTITILTTQNRQNRNAEERAQLDLQINLLAEQKIAKLIDLVEELRRDMPTVRDRVDEIADIMKEPVDPHAVLSALEETLEARAAPSEAAADVKDPAPRETGEPGKRRVDV